MVHIVFAWPGLPDYAARQIRAVVELDLGLVSVVGTRPRVPFESLENSLGLPVRWVDGRDASICWRSIGVDVPDILFVGGYNVPAFRRISREARNLGKLVVLMSDNNWVGSIRQRLVEPVRHRLLYRPLFEAILVPGESARKLAIFQGYSGEKIFSGLYGADGTLFSGGAPLAAREKNLLFVGQFVPRKNVLGLVSAFLEFHESNPDWKLHLCGSGEQLELLPRHRAIFVHGFKQPQELAQLFRSSRCLVLPSFEEHWGLVVHEAALSGCALALSKTVGAADDIGRVENCLLFNPRDRRSLCGSLESLASWSDSRWAEAESVSRQMAERFGPRTFARSVSQVVGQLIGSSRE